MPGGAAHIMASRHRRPPVCLHRGPRNRSRHVANPAARHAIQAVRIVAQDPIDFLLTAKRDTKAALRFIRQAIRNNGTPEKINIDKSGANTAAIKAYNEETGTSIEIRQCKYLNNIVEQDHRPSKRKMHQALGFKEFHAAHATLQGVEAVQMIRKGQVRPVPGGTFIDQFNALGA